jgi:hypothetical protein
MTVAAFSDKPTAIAVLELRRVSNCGSVRAFVTLRCGGFTIHGVKIVAQDGQNRGSPCRKRRLGRKPTARALAGSRCSRPRSS